MLNINDNDFHTVNEFDNFFAFICPLCGETSDYSCGELSKISSSVKNIIERNKEQITINLTPQQTLLRARKATAKELSHDPDDAEEVRFWKGYLDCYFANSGVRELQCAFIKKQGNIEKIFSTTDIGIHNGYLGYSKDKCGAPPPVNSKIGRCNEKGESVLYLGDTVETCLLECNACRKEIFSIGEFVPQDTLTICDLEKLAKIDYCGLWISEIFSYVSQENEYKKSQALTRIIKELGYDGVKYLSAKSTNGHCVAVFDPKKCECKRSYLVKPLNGEITYEC